MSLFQQIFSYSLSKQYHDILKILATLAIALGPFAAGLGKGYSSPALASLQSLNTIQQQQQQLHVPTPSPFDRMEESNQWDNSSSLLSSSASLAASAVAATVGTSGFSVSNQEVRRALNHEPLYLYQPVDDIICFCVLIYRPQ